jgi:hypothetical protein
MNGSLNALFADNVWFDNFDRSNEPVAPPGNSLDEPGIAGIVLKRLSYLENSDTEALVEIDKRIAGPEPLSYLGTRNYGAPSLQQQGEKMKRLFLQFNPQTAPRQRPSGRIEGKESKAIDRFGRRSGIHSDISSLRRTTIERADSSMPSAAIPTN